MLKAEELKILEQIEKLIDHAGADSYIRMTFAGIVDVCRNNIENDFGVIPVQDMEEYLEALDAERRMHDETKRQLAQAQELWKQSMDEVDSLRKQVAELRDESGAMSDSLEGLTEIIDELEERCETKDAEIVQLRAEIVRMRMERMSDEEIARFYNETKECY